MFIYQNSDSLPAQEADPITIRLSHLYNTQQWLEFDKLYNTLLQQSNNGVQVATAILKTPSSKNRNFTELHRLTTPLIKSAFYELWFNRVLVFSFTLALMAFYSTSIIGTSIITPILFIPLALVSFARALFLIFKTKGNSELGIQAESPWAKFIASLLTLFASLIFVLNYAAISNISSLFTFAPLILFIAIAIEFVPIVARAFEKKEAHFATITFLSLIAMYFALAAIFPGLDVMGLALPLAIAALATILLIHNYDSNNSNTAAWQAIVIAQILPELEQNLAVLRNSAQELNQNDILRKANALIVLKNRVDVYLHSINELSGTVVKNTAQQMQRLKAGYNTLSNTIVQQLITPLSNRLAQFQVQIPNTATSHSSSSSNAAAIEAKSTLEYMRNALELQLDNLKSINPLLITLEQNHLPVAVIRSEYTRLLNEFTTKLSSTKLTMDRITQFVEGYQLLNEQVNKIAAQDFAQLDLAQLENSAEELRNAEKSQIQLLNGIMISLRQNPQMQSDKSFTKTVQLYCELKVQVVELQGLIFRQILAKTYPSLQAINNSDSRCNILKYQIERAEFLQWTYKNTALGVVNKSYELNANSSLIQANRNEIATLTSVPSGQLNSHFA